jgi:hypothetical protein
VSHAVNVLLCGRTPGTDPLSRQEQLGEEHAAGALHLLDEDHGGSGSAALRCVARLQGMLVGKETGTPGGREFERERVCV